MSLLMKVFTLEVLCTEHSLHELYHPYNTYSICFILHILLLFDIYFSVTAFYLYNYNFIKYKFKNLPFEYTKKDSTLYEC